ncbi:homoserine dehydrogenase [Schizosaccharomyces japonicus yFS275]|uniref:Homoserine dehydrogenase n=1 Tax=Schizosaccharomyces japonicus (strain yFS275 / FY16936) TaxID=402676 RepID=B6K3G8_SCHJY|nr:homoserine dehydrogenase [Schizosaccharomyces japonicus yFS275]EEB08025.2 homoserine dehydrogenase [Schizosaccharomyces japonicus yFS275]
MYPTGIRPVLSSLGQRLSQSFTKTTVSPYTGRFVRYFSRSYRSSPIRGLSSTLRVPYRSFLSTNLTSPYTQKRTTMSAQKTSVNVAVIGTGNIGGELLNQIQGFNISAKAANTPQFNVVAISSIEGHFISKDYSPIDLGNWKAVSQTGNGPASFEVLADFLGKSTLPAIVVDNTASEAVAYSYPLFLSKGINIATPNKKAFSAPLAKYKEIIDASRKSGALLMHESSVGAGLPIISTLKELILTGDEILKVEGIFSGTMSYIFNNWSPNGKKGTAAFSEVVKVAKDNGFTEPDPRDDLNGMDVARKVTILSRIAGLDIESPEAFPVHSLIPEPLVTAASADDFMAGLPAFDASIAAVREAAEKEGKVVRFVGESDLVSKKTSVSLKSYETTHPFANLQHADNIISFTTKRYSTTPLVVIGAGAGAAVTAAGVLGDMIKILSQVRAADAPSKN